MTSTETARMLVLIPYLQAHPGVHLADVAAHFQVRPDRLKTDLWSLYCCGLPGGLPGDLIEVDMDEVNTTGRIFLTNADYLSRPLRLSAHEAVIVLAGLGSLREIAGEADRSIVTSATDKIRRALGSGAELGDRLQVEVNRGRATVLNAITAAITGGNRIQLTHYGDGKAPHWRRLDPVTVEFHRGYAYLIAWDIDRAAWRTFRLDRISDAEVTGTADDHGSAPALDELWTTATNQADVVELRLDPTAAWVAEHYPITDSRRDGDDIVVSVAVLDGEWLTRLLLRLGGHGRIEGHHLATARAAESARQALAAYADLPNAAPGTDIG